MKHKTEYNSNKKPLLSFTHTHIGKLGIVIVKGFTFYYLYVLLVFSAIFFFVIDSHVDFLWAFLLCALSLEYFYTRRVHLIVDSDICLCCYVLELHCTYCSSATVISSVLNPKLFLWALHMFMDVLLLAYTLFHLPFHSSMNHFPLPHSSFIGNPLLL